MKRPGGRGMLSVCQNQQGPGEGGAEKAAARTARGKVKKMTAEQVTWGRVVCGVPCEEFG